MSWKWLLESQAVCKLNTYLILYICKHYYYLLHIYWLLFFFSVCENYSFYLIIVNLDSKVKNKQINNKY